MQYPAAFTPDEDGVLVVTFRDIPEALTQGQTEEEALAMAEDALLTAMDFYFDDRRPIPAPSAALPGERLVALPASVSAKVLLLNEMLAQSVSQSELARRMGTRPQDVQRLVALTHASKIDNLEAAMRALGKRFDIRAA